MHRRLRPWQGTALALALSICVLGVVGCGGGASGDQASKVAPAGELAKAQPGPAQAKAHDAPVVVTKGKRHSARAVPAPAAPRVVHSATAIGTAPAHPSSPSVSSHRKAPPRHSKPTPPPRGKSSSSAKPAGPAPIPPSSATDPYTAARNTCSDRANLDLVPPQYRGDPEFLATMYAQAFDPQHEGAAHDGCLAGLHDLGL